MPELKEGEVLTRVLSATICGSDLHSFHGRRSSPAPSILGHEMVGEVVGTGHGGARYYDSALAVCSADRISWSMVWSCGACFCCTHQLRPKCERLMKFGHESTDSDHPLAGGFSEYCILPRGTSIFRVPARVPDAVASPANCATATVAAMFRSAPAGKGQTVIIYGAGMLGLTACAMAHHQEAAQVISIDTDVTRRALATRFGAGTVLDGRLPGPQIEEQVRHHTSGRGADVLFDLTGHPDAMECGFKLLRPGGCVILAGAVFPARPLAISAEDVVRRMLRIQGVYNYAPEDLGMALAFLEATVDRYPFHELAPRIFPLAAINEAFAYAEQHKPPRVVIRP